MGKEIDRRSFLKGVAATGALAATAGFVGCTPSAQESSEAPKAGDTGAAPVIQSEGEPFAIEALKISDVTADKTLETEYLVIGSGNCGLLSAARAAEQGVDVILLEKNSVDGGSSFGTEAHFALNTVKYIKEQGLKTWTFQEAADYFNLFNGFRSDQTLVSSFLHHSNEAFDWWIEKGAKVETLLNSLAGEGTGAGLFFEGKAAALADIDREVLAQYEVQILTSTGATNLLLNDDGSIAGALAKDDAGTVLVKAKAVLVATGGFGTNPKMVSHYLGARGDSANVGDAILKHDGDGINMLFGAGGIPGVLDSVQCGGIYTEGTDFDGPLGRAGGEPYLWVNKFGQRVGCEFWNNPTYPYERAAWSPDFFFYNVFDSTMVTRMETQDFFCQTHYLPYVFTPEPEMGAIIDKAVADGIMFKADSLEDLAAQAGIDKDGFLSTVKAYNDKCAKGEDEEFFKDPAMLLPISKAPFYGIKLITSRLSTLCGAQINEDCQVVNKDGAWIKGLFAGGLDSAGFFMTDYNHAFSGSCSSYSFFTGFHAANTAVKFIKG